MNNTHKIVEALRLIADVLEGGIMTESENDPNKYEKQSIDRQAQSLERKKVDLDNRRQENKISTARSAQRDNQQKKAAISSKSRR